MSKWAAVLFASEPFRCFYWFCHWVPFRIIKVRLPDDDLWNCWNLHTGKSLGSENCAKSRCI